MGKRHKQKGQKGQVDKAAAPVKVFKPRCSQCGSKIKNWFPDAPQKDYYPLVWKEGKEWPQGAFRANCRKCGGYVIVLPDGKIHAVEGKDMWVNLPDENWLVKQARIKQRADLPTIVMCGTSPDSAGLIPWDDPNVSEFWGLNDAHVLDMMRMDKITRWYQLHHRWRFTRRSPRYGENDHWGWLKRKHDFPIYMQKVQPDVPNSVEFPLREITRKLLFKKLGRGTGFQRKYYTCSFAFALAHAIVELEEKYRPENYNPLTDEPFARIEMYGVELAQEIEYVMQRPSTEFWVGYAMARGIQVYVPAKTRILQGTMYGYRFPDRMSEAKGLWDHKQKEGEPISQEEAWKQCAGEDLPDDDNVGAWEDYGDVDYNILSDDPYGLGDLYGENGDELGVEEVPFTGDPNAVKSGAM